MSNRVYNYTMLCIASREEGTELTVVWMCQVKSFGKQWSLDWNLENTRQMPQTLYRLRLSSPHYAVVLRASKGHSWDLSGGQALTRSPFPAAQSMTAGCTVLSGFWSLRCKADGQGAQRRRNLHKITTAVVLESQVFSSYRVIFCNLVKD